VIHSKPVLGGLHHEYSFAPRVHDGVTSAQGPQRVDRRRWAARDHRGGLRRGRSAAAFWYTTVQLAARACL